MIKRNTQLIRIIILFLFISTSFSAVAKRRGLAQKYEIPPLDESHIVMGTPQNSKLNGKSIKVLVWNLLKAERKNWKRDFINLSANKDILLLQEGYLNRRTEDTFKALRMFRFDMGVSFLYKKDNKTPTGTVVGSRVAPVDAGFLRTKDYEPLIKTPKTLTYAKYPIRGRKQTLLAISLHGMNFTKQYAYNNQIDQALTLIDAHKGPVIFAGDFNSRTKKRLKYLKDRMKARDLKELSYLNDKRMKVFGNILDHTFARGFLVRNSRVLHHIKSSDHKAIELDLVLDTI